MVLGHHADRVALARDFGATDIVRERADEALERVRELTNGLGAHSVLECVGLAEACSRPCGSRGREAPSAASAFLKTRRSTDPVRPSDNNVTISGGPAPVRAYIGELLPDILDGRINPGRVFDRGVGLEQVPEGYRAMIDREALKVMIQP